MLNPQVTRRSGPHPWWVAVIAGLASFVDGAALSANGWALVILQDAIGLSGGQFGALTAATTVGLAIGALVGGRLGDVYGRRRVFMVTLGLVVVASFAPMLSQNFWVLLLGLTVLGIGAGADLPVSLATIAEAADDHNRGAMLGFTHALWILGSLAILVTTAMIGDQGISAVRVLYGIVVVVGAIGLLLRLTIPESPAWLATREERRQGIPTVRSESVKLRDLMTNPLRRVVLMLAAFYALVSITGNVLAGYIAYIATNVADISIEAISGPSALLYPFGFVALFVFMRLVDTRLRMPMYIWGGVVFAGALLIPVVFGISLISLLLCFGLSALGGMVSGGEPMARVWSNESFPTMLRSTGQGVVFTVGRLAVAASAAVAPAVISWSPNAFFLGLFATAALGTIIGWFGFRGEQAVNEFDRERELVA